MRELIEAGLAEEAAHAGDVLLRVFEQVGGGVARGAHLHAAELMQRKETLALAHAFLGEESGAWVGHLDGDNEHDKNRREQHQTHEG